MASLSNELEAVIDALSSSINIRLQTLSTNYRQTIQENAEALDSAGRGARDAPLSDRAIKSSKTCEILFGENVLTPDEPSYKEKQLKNWYSRSEQQGKLSLSSQGP
jgi:hypothetical protein